MKYLHYLSITFLLLISSCQHSNQMVVINSDAPKLAIDKYYNKKLNLRVVDSRENKDFIGFKTPVSIWQFTEEYKDSDYLSDDQSSIAILSNNQDLAAIIQKKLAENLNSRGLKLKRFTINQLSGEILELSVIPTTYRTGIYSKIKVKAINKAGDLEKIYEKKIISYKPMLSAIFLGPLSPDLGDEYYNRIINDCLDQNIQSIISDNQLWNFLD